MTRNVKYLYRFLAMILIFLMVLSTPCAVQNISADTHLEATITRRVELYGDLGVEYHVKLNQSITLTDVSLKIQRQKFSGSGSAFTWETVELKDYSIENGEYIFRYYGLSPVEMPNLVRAVFSGKSGSRNFVSDQDEFSLRTYCQDLLSKYAGSTAQKDKELCTLLADLLNYGAATQKYYNINTTDLANAKLTDAQKALASKLPTSFTSCYAFTQRSGSTCTIDHFEMEDAPTTYLSAYLRFTSNTDNNTFLQMTYTSAKGEKKTVKVPFSEFVYDSTAKLYKVPLQQVKAPDYQSALTVTVKKNSTAISGTYTYSVESYVKALVDAAGNSYDEAGWLYVQNLMAFAASSRKYFGGSGSGNTPTPTKKATLTPTKKPTNSPTPTKKPTNTPTPTPFSGSYVTYKQFGAKGDGKTDDYQAIVKTHAYANEHNLPVKADPGATYYIHDMDVNNKKGALIMTDTDWGDAKFIIDDESISLSQDECFLFTVEPSRAYGDLKKSGTYLGMDPRITNLPFGTVADSTAQNLLNKTFSKDTTQFQLPVVNGVQQKFAYKALYILETTSVNRWGRNGSGSGASGQSKLQSDVIVVDENGKIDDLSPVQWDWFDISRISVYPIDEQLLTVQGGTFTTIVSAHKVTEGYIYRGMLIMRSNVLIKNVKHYLQGEEKQFDGKNSYYVQYKKDNNGNIVKDENGNPIIVKEEIHAKFGSPYHAFFELRNCMNVTLLDCVFSNHLQVYNKGNETDSTSPYDYYAEYCVNITIDGCTCAQTNWYTVEYYKGLYGIDNFPKIPLPKDEDGIMDRQRWGTTGTNYVKNLNLYNSSINRIDAHKGTYNLTVKNSVLGHKGIAAVGFGVMLIEDSIIRSDHFINLRVDFGCAWYGDVIVRNCTWKLGKNYAPRFFNVGYQPNPKYPYGYDIIEENGIPYYSSLPTNVYINGLTLDASEVESTSLYNTSGLQMFTSPIYGLGNTTVDDNYLKNRTAYPCPLRFPKLISLKNFVLIKNPIHERVAFTKVSLINPTSNHVEYFFKDTVFDFDIDKDLTVKIAG